MDFELSNQSLSHPSLQGVKKDFHLLWKNKQETPFAVEEERNDYNYVASDY